MNEKDFVKLCRQSIVTYYRQLTLQDYRASNLTTDDVYIVWLCKTLQNSKALASTDIPDGKYFEITYNGDQHQAYLDVYKKEQNIEINVKDINEV